MSGDTSPSASGKRRHPGKRYLETAPQRSTIQRPPYVELCACSNFSFLHGASHPEEMVEQAFQLGLSGIALADLNSFAGVVRAHAAALKIQKVDPNFQYIPGVRLVPFSPPATQDGAPIQTGPEIVTLPQNRAAFGRLSKLLTQGNRAAPKGRCYLTLPDICAVADDQIGIVVPPRAPTNNFRNHLRHLKTAFGNRLYLAITRPFLSDDMAHLSALENISKALKIPLVATSDALYHSPDRRILQDAITCIRTGQKISDAGFTIHQNGERHLKDGAQMLHLFPQWQDAVQRTNEVAARCTFSLTELRYEYPGEIIGKGDTPQARLEHITWAGAQKRYPRGVPQKVTDILNKELALIEQLDYARYFLTVYDIVEFAKGEGILCQGRGSAANSAVCYVTGITAVNPMEVDLLVERFISAARDEPPDIDVDFEHERREEVIQYIYQKYGRHRAGIAATVITYRWKSAIREIGKVMGLSDDITGVLSKMLSGWTAHGSDTDMIREAGLDPADPLLTMTVELARSLEGFPRHLSQHVGGFVITRGPLEEVMPIHNAAMKDRTFVEWDKDDLDTLKMLKIDVLALGMLTCIRKCFELIKHHYGRPLTLADIPRDDPATYAMIQKADTVGTFQIESRAQMSMLPRLKPRTFYDLVVEVAIVRPGPIQGDMVHPYLRRRDGIEPIEYAIPELKPVLEKTHGVPLFQEQAMKIAIVGAGFTGEEANELRRAMATFRRNGTIHLFEEKLINGLVGRGAPREFAERCFEQIKGFGDYGFPESHAASFALLAYASAWLKCHYPAAFACALLNSQPMGFYRPAQIVRDAREHAVTVLPADVNESDWDNTLSPHPDYQGLCLRLGLRQVKGLKEGAVDALLGNRQNGYDSARHVWLRTQMDRRSLIKLAEADCFTSIGLERRDALWAAQAIENKPATPLLQFVEREEHEEEASLPPMTLGEEVVHDYMAMGLTLRTHPIELLQAHFPQRCQATHLSTMHSGQAVHVAGLVLNRQRPGTAKGVIFMTLEDETGSLNIIVWAKAFEAYRKVVLTSKVMEVYGELQNESGVIHIIAKKLVCRNDLFETLLETEQATPEAVASPNADRWLPRSRDFH